MSLLTAVADDSTDSASPRVRRVAEPAADFLMETEPVTRAAGGTRVAARVTPAPTEILVLLPYGELSAEQALEIADASREFADGGIVLGQAQIVIGPVAEKSLARVKDLLAWRGLQPESRAAGSACESCSMVNGHEPVKVRSDAAHHPQANHAGLNGSAPAAPIGSRRDGATMPGSFAWMPQAPGNRWACVVTLNDARASAEQLEELAVIANRLGDGTLRITRTGSVVLLNIPTADRQAVQREFEPLRLTAQVG